MKAVSKQKKVPLQETFTALFFIPLVLLENLSLFSCAFKKILANNSFTNK